MKCDVENIFRGKEVFLKLGRVVFLEERER